jgi:N4-gp56 family major capsid protein
MGKYTATASSGDFVGIPEDILKVHTQDILFTAMPAMRYDQFAIVKTDLQVQPGGAIVFSKYGNLPRGGKIAETEDAITKSMSKSNITISVDEYINAVGLTSKFLTLAFMDEMATASILLGRDYALVTDIMLRDALFSGTQTYLVNKKAELKDITADDTIDLDDIDNVVEILKTGNVLPYSDSNGQYYVGYFHPHVIKSIKKSLTTIRQYAYPELIFKGEVGEYNQVRFIETSNVPNGAAPEDKDEANNYIDAGFAPSLKEGYEYASGKTLATDLYKGVIFGERAYGWAVALPVELREDTGQANFGRKRALAWYAIMGAGKIVNENIVVVITA